MENENTCHCSKKKDRSDKERKDLMNRLSRIEGQIRGIKGCFCHNPPEEWLFLSIFFIHL